MNEILIHLTFVTSSHKVKATICWQYQNLFLGVPPAKRIKCQSHREKSLWRTIIKPQSSNLIWLSVPYYVSGPHETFNCLLIEHEVGGFLCLQVFGQLLILLVMFFGWQLVFLSPLAAHTGHRTLSHTNLSPDVFPSFSFTKRQSRK